jgi:hypothetical protein
VEKVPSPWSITSWFESPPPWLSRKPSFTPTTVPPRMAVTGAPIGIRKS